MQLSRAKILFFIIGVSMMLVNGLPGTVEDQLIREWVQVTRLHGWDLDDDYCDWIGFTCNATGYVTRMLFEPAVQQSVIYGELPDVPAWTARANAGEAFTSLTSLVFRSYRTGPRLPLWINDHYNSTPFNFILDTTPSLICYQHGDAPIPCPLQDVQPPCPAPCDLVNISSLPACEVPYLESVKRNWTCSNANIAEHRPNHGPQEGGNMVIIAVNLPLGYLSISASFGHLDGYTTPVPIEQLYLLSYAWGEANNTLNETGNLGWFTSLVVVHAPPHPPGAVDLNLYVGTDRLTTSFNAQYYYECPPGTRANVTGIDPFTNLTESTCVPCPLGYYSDQFGSEVCIPCPAGSYNDEEGATSCKLCSAGTYSTAEAAEEPDTCIPCDVGTANPLPGQSTCVTCTPGYYQPDTGKFTCLACPAGSYGTGNGDTSCTLCLPGSHQPSEAQTSCIFCSTSNYASSVGSTRCYPCRAGTTTSGRNATFCDVTCQAGEYRNEGTAYCIKCAPGRYTESSGLAVCKLCPVGSYNTQYGENNCTSCEGETINYQIGSTSCFKPVIRQGEDYTGLYIGVLLLIVAVILIICAVSYVVYKKRQQRKKKSELKQLRNLMPAGAAE